MGAAAERAGVHYMTLYRWIRTGRLAAEQHDGRWQVRTADVDAVVEGGAGRSAAPRRGKPDLARYRSRLHARLAAADEVGAWAVLQAAQAAGCSAVDVHLRIIAPVLRDVGSGWQAGRLTVAQEHVVTAVASRLVVRMGPRFRRLGRSKGAVVLACAPGDLHALPLTLLGDVLRRQGYDVVELGGYTPAEVLVEAARAVDSLVAVGIGVSTEATWEAAPAAAAAVRRALPGVPVLIGGAAVPSARVASRLGADGWGADALAVARLLDRWHGSGAAPRH